jgi:hypothetical protein
MPVNPQYLDEPLVGYEKPEDLLSEGGQRNYT